MMDAALGFVLGLLAFIAALEWRDLHRDKRQ